MLYAGRIRKDLMIKHIYIMCRVILWSVLAAFAMIAVNAWAAQRDVEREVVVRAYELCVKALYRQTIAEFYAVNQYYPYCN